MILPKIALKNLSRQKRRSFLLGGALAFGMLILTLVNGVMGGLLSSVEKSFSDLIVGHIFFTEIERTEKGRIVLSVRDDKPLLDAIERLGIPVTYMARRTMYDGTMVYAGESSYRNLSGVDWNEEKQISQSLDMLAGSTDGMAGSDGILISENSAEKLKMIPAKEPDSKTKKAWDALPKAEREAKQAEWKAVRDEAMRKSIGEAILLQLTTVTGQQNLGEFRVKGIFATSFDLYAYTDRAVLNRLVGMPNDGYNQFGMFLADFGSTNAWTLRLAEELKTQYDLVPMTQIMGKGVTTVISDMRKTGFQGTKSVLTNINNELAAFTGVFTAIQYGALGFFVILLLVIMVGIVNTFRIVVYERTREIGTMRSLGMQRKSVRNIFLLEALFLALGGLAAGFVLAAVILFIVSLIKWNVAAGLALFFDQGHLQIAIDPFQFVITVVIVSGLTLLAALIPARRAARLEPATALRTHY